jgi:outer membrane protein assembly factor BamB
MQPPAGELQLHGSTIIASGPHGIACFGADVSRPVWSKTRQGFPARAGDDFHRLLASMSFLSGNYLRPCVAGHRLFTRWDRGDQSGLLKAVAAFDLTTGALLWSTARTSAMEGRTAAGDPTYADGRLFVLMLAGTSQAVSPLFLTCIDPENGAVLWDRHIGSEDPSDFTGVHMGRHRFGLAGGAQAASRVTVHRGAVYCATNLGFVGRYDARDGTLEWLRTYDTNHGAHGNVPVIMLPGLLTRRSSAPIPVGRGILFAPRDSKEIFCLDARSGALLWSTDQFPAAVIVGRWGTKALLQDEERLVCLDGASGEVAWDHQVKSGKRGRPLLNGSVAYVGTKQGLLKLDLATGKTLEDRVWPGGEPFDAFVVRGSVLVGTAWKPRPADG